MKRTMIVAIASLTAALAVIGTAGVANAAHSVDVGDGLTLVGRGAGVVVPVAVTCEPPVFPPFPFPGGSSLTVSVTQRHGNRIADGEAYARAVCDGTPHVVEVLVPANQAPFRQGVALVTASMFVCDSTGCHEAEDTQELDISKP